MKNIKIVSIIIFIVLLIPLILIPLNTCQANSKTGKITIRSFDEIFDFYIYPKSIIRSYDCDIDNNPYKYHEAVPPGKKPLKRNAQYVGRGKINLKKIISYDQDLEQIRITVFKLIDIELEKGLSFGIKAIEDMFTSQEDVCYNNPRLNSMIKKLEEKIKIESKNNGSIEDIKNGRILLEKLKCF
jgi:hypothetical protein